MSRTRTLFLGARIVWGLGAIIFVAAVVAVLLGAELSQFSLALVALVTIVGGHVLGFKAERERELDHYILNQERTELGLPEIPEATVEELSERLRRIRHGSNASIVLGIAAGIVGVLLAPIGLGFVGAFGHWLFATGGARRLIAHVEGGSIATMARERAEQARYDDVVNSEPPGHRETLDRSDS